MLESAKTTLLDTPASTQPMAANPLPLSQNPDTPPAVLEFRNFSFFYGSEQILDKISFRVGRGGWLSILGGNGSGKSTLLKNALRLVRGRTFGEIHIAGRPLSQYSQRDLARILAYVPQAGGYVPPFTVREFINLSRYPYGFQNRSDNCASMREAMDLCAIAHLAARRMDQLSGGQRQRVYLAAAMGQNTDVLLLDEPTSFLDPAHVHTINELLKMLHNERHYTIITVTHDLSQPLDTGGDALILRQGRQVYFGPASALPGSGILEKAFSHEFSYLVHPRSGKTLVIA